MENLTSNAAVKVDSNVTIRVLDSNQRVIRTTKVHNKATVHMVTGLLEFLSGAFNPVNTNPNSDATTPQEVTSYIPVELHLGTVGVKMTDRDSDKPKLLGINRSDFKIPTFDDYKLQNDITSYYTATTDGLTLKFDTVNLTNFDDPNNSMGLLLMTKLPAGQLTGIGEGTERVYFTDSVETIGSGNGWVYYNPYTARYESIFTELGLFSNTGDLLARVLLNDSISVTDEGEIIFDDDLSDVNPLIQSDNTSLVVEWRIGIISLGQNDYVISESKTVPQLESISERNILRKYISGNMTVVTVPDPSPTASDSDVYVRDYAFKGMSNVVTVIFPEQLVEIGTDAFDGTSLAKIYYKGSEEQWNSIVINDDTINDGIESGDITIIYNYLKEE